MHHDLTFETDRFNLSEVKEHFINPCCFGEDLAGWLRDKLLEKGLEATQPDQEDWGWYIEANYRGDWYFIGIGGNPDEFGKNNNQGEWRVMIKKHRSVWEKLTRKNEMSGAEEMMNLIREVIEMEPDFNNVRCENGAPAEPLNQMHN